MTSNRAAARGGITSATQTAPNRPASAQFFKSKQQPTTLVNALGLEIVSGGYEAGALLPNEAVMRETYGVSRTALREAYSKLTAKGLVVARPKVGTSVRDKRHWNMLDQDVLAWHLQSVPAADIAQDLYALRRLIEPGAAEMAAACRTDADIDLLYAAFADMRDNTSVETDLVEADFAFHVAVLTATRNPFISGFSALIRAAMISTFEVSWRGADVIKERRLEQHKAVADAIRDGDGARARNLMQDLLDDSINDVRDVLDERDQ
ncbi:FadR/GntR family transcriptional regulator [Celeribacter sp.]|uniref:FadR/GntR family transcriptional regulator n=1 Tax=Celeribacter sp. TaxID=1890673 RepID=UPI003A914B20